MIAPGGPGIRPTWTSSAKDLAGTAVGPSRLWMTVGYGIVNEVYYPRVDTPQIRDLGFIVADGNGFWVEVKRNADYNVVTPGPGIPAIEILHRHSRFELRLRIAPDLMRDVLLIEANLTGDADLKLYALLAPHLEGNGVRSTAEVFVDRNRKVLGAEQGPHAVDRPEPVWLRYGGNKPRAVRAHWTRRMRIGFIRAGQTLRFVFAEPALVHWGIDNWQQPQDTITVPGMLGLQVADLASEALEPGQRLVFSIQDRTTGNWIEPDRVIEVVAEGVIAQGMAEPTAFGQEVRDAAD